MTSPQVEDGYTRLANELFEAIIRFDFTKREIKVVMAVVRKTYGFGKKEDEISLSQIEKMTGVHRNHVSSTVSDLSLKNVLNYSRGSRGLRLGVNKNYSEWATKTAKSESANGLPKQLNHGADELAKTVTTETAKSPPELAKTVTHTDKERVSRFGCSGVTKTANLGLPKQLTTKENIKKTITKENILSSAKDSIDKSKQKKSTRIPGDFLVTEELRTWADDKGVFVDLELETEQWIDYHRAKGTLAKDWAASWRTWMRNSIKFNSRPKHKTDKHNDFDNRDYREGATDADELGW